MSCQRQQDNPVRYERLPQDDNGHPSVCLRIRCKLDAILNKIRYVSASTFPASRQLRADIVIGTGLYYIDILLDGRACVTFASHGKYHYVGAICASIATNAIVSMYTSEGEGHSGMYSILGPAIVARRAMSLKPSVAAEKTDWNDEDIAASHQVIRTLRDLRTELQHLTGHEATIESPVNTFIQLMAAVHMHRDAEDFTSDEFFLWLSVGIGMLTMVKSFVAWETFGRVHMKLAGFSYVIGAGGSRLTLGCFRLVEIASRLCSVLMTYQTLITVLDFWWLHYILPVYALVISMITFGIGTISLPRTKHHLVQCLPSFFLFPAPLNLPCNAKAACTSALTHYVLRGLETTALVLLQGYLIDFNFDSHVADFLGNTILRVNMILAGLFVLFSALLMASMRTKNHDRVKEMIAEQLLVNNGNQMCMRWPDNPHIRHALLPYGYKMEKSHAPKAVSFSGKSKLSADGWKMSLEGVADSAEEFSFEDCGLTDEKAKALREALQRFAAVKKVDFSENRELSADGWKTLLGGVADSAEEFSFAACALTDEKAKALREALQRFAAAKTVDFQGNQKLSADGWKTLLGGIADSAEEFRLAYCALTDEKAKALREALQRFAAAKKVDFSNTYDSLSADGWKTLLGGVADSAKELLFRWCVLTDEKAPALRDALQRFAAAKKVDFTGNSCVSADGWKTLLGGVADSAEEFSFADCALTDEKATALREALQRFAAAKKVDFSENRELSADGWKTLLGGVADSAEEFSFADCALTDDKAQALQESLQHRLKGKLFDFSENPGFSMMARAVLVNAFSGNLMEAFECLFTALSAEGESGIPDVLEMKGVCSLEVSPSKHLTLKDAEFTWINVVPAKRVHIRDVTAPETLDSVLGVAASVEELSFQESALTDEKTKALRDALQRFAAAKKVDFSKNSKLSADGWKTLLGGVTDSAEEFGFLGCDLTDEKAKALRDALQRFAAAKKVDFTGNQKLSADGWKTLFGGVADSAEEFRFAGCVLTDEKATALRDALQRFAAAKKIDFSGDYDLSHELSADGWETLLGGVADSAEEFSFKCCNFSDEKAKVLRDALQRFAAAKKVDFTGNSCVSADGWKTLLGGVADSAEEFSFADCALTDEKATALREALQRFAAAKKVDFTENRELSADGWKTLLGGVADSAEEFRSCQEGRLFRKPRVVCGWLEDALRGRFCFCQCVWGAPD